MEPDAAGERLGGELLGFTFQGQEGFAVARLRLDRGEEIVAIGPLPMMRAVAELTRRLGQSCQLCIERFMACGMGTCLSCVVRVRQADGGTRWALTCSEGPVFERDTLACWD